MKPPPKPYLLGVNLTLEMRDHLRAAAALHGVRQAEFVRAALEQALYDVPPAPDSQGAVERHPVAA